MAAAPSPAHASDVDRLQLQRHAEVRPEAFQLQKAMLLAQVGQQPLAGVGQRRLRRPCGVGSGESPSRVQRKRDHARFVDAGSAVQRPWPVRPNAWAEYCRMTTVTSLRFSIWMIWYWLG